MPCHVVTTTTARQRFGSLSHDARRAPLSGPEWGAKQKPPRFAAESGIRRRRAARAKPTGDMIAGSAALPPAPGRTRSPCRRPPAVSLQEKATRIASDLPRRAQDLPCGLSRPALGGAPSPVLLFAAAAAGCISSQPRAVELMSVSRPALHGCRGE